jgi:adhesin transport system membrane fusion protein
MAELTKPTEQRDGSELLQSIFPHVTYALCAVMTLSFLLWAWFSTLDIVSIATGEVIPSTQVKHVQHLEGGIVQQILVQEGDRVSEDQPLVVLAPTSSSADVSELQVRLTSLRIDLHKYEALLNSLDSPIYPVYEDDLLRNNAAGVQQSIRSFETARKRLQDDLEKQKQTIAQKESAIEEVRTRIRNRQRNLAIITEQVKISDSLLVDNLTNRMKHLDLLKEQSTLSGSIEEDKATQATAEAALQEARATMRAIRSTFDAENRKALDEARLSLNELSQRMSKFKDSFNRTTIRSPVDGVVKTIHVATLGGVVKAGEPVVDIVPENDRLIIEAKLQTSDIGYIQEGQPAMVRLASAESNRFGGLSGQVIAVSPDTLLTPDNKPFYKVRIETERNYFESRATRYNLFPGMQVIANIHTGTRTVVEYLLNPYLSRLSDAMHER